MKARIYFLILSIIIFFKSTALGNYEKVFYDFKINDYLKENLSQFSYIGLDSNKIKKATIKFLLHKRKKILIYTVNDLATARKLKSWGVTAIFTNFPKSLASLKFL